MFVLSDSHHCETWRDLIQHRLSRGSMGLKSKSDLSIELTSSGEEMIVVSALPQEVVRINELD